MGPWLLAAAHACGCAGPARPAHPEPPNAAPTPPSASVSVAPTAASAASGARPVDAPAKPESFEGRYPPDQAVSGREWLARIKAHGSIAERQCWALGLNVGLPGAPGVLCVAPVPHVLAQRGTVYVFAEEKLRAVWQAVIAAGSGWLSLTPVLSSDGRRLELREPRPKTCERVLCHYEQKLAYGIDGGFGSALEDACSALGGYEFRDGKFVLVERTGPGPYRAAPTEAGGLGCGE